MKEIYLLLLFLIPSSKNSYYIYKNVQIDDPLPTSLSTSISIITYFYISYPTSYDYRYIYIHISDNSYGLSSISYCFSSTSPPYDSHAVDSCGPYISLDYYEKKTSGNIINYYYKIDTNPRINYIIIKYSGIEIVGSLNVKCSVNDLNRDVELSTTPVSLPSYAIALIVICLVFSLATLIIDIFIIRKI